MSDLIDKTLIFGLDFLQLYLPSIKLHLIFTVIRWSADIFWCVVCLEPSELFACLGKQFLDPVNDSSMFGTGDVSLVLVGMERCKQTQQKLPENCKSYINHRQTDFKCIFLFCF